MSTTESATEPLPTWSYETYIVDGKVCVAIGKGTSCDANKKYASSERRLRALIARAERICARRNAKARSASQLLTDVTSTLPSTFTYGAKVRGH